MGSDAHDREISNFRVWGLDKSKGDMMENSQASELMKHKKVQTQTHVGPSLSHPSWAGRLGLL